MQAFYGSRLSGHLSQTPEGFLICHGARLSRTAVNTPQKYRGSEIGLSSDEEVDVYRSAQEVTNRASLASLEGKPVCDNHPAQFLTAENVGWYAKGHVQHVREGDPLPDGEHAIVGDLVITDAGLIAKIKGGMKNISVGYDCEYAVRDDGSSFEQRKIRANHIAVVANGRAGEHVRILDTAGERELSFGAIARQFHRKNAVAVAAELASAPRTNDSLFDDYAEAQRLNDETVKQSLIKFGVLRPEDEDIPMSHEKLSRQDSARLDEILRAVRKIAGQQTNHDDDLTPTDDSAVTDRAREARDFEFMLRAYRNLSPMEGRRRVEAAAEAAARSSHITDSVEDPDRRYEASIKAARKAMLAAQVGRRK
jgi:Uncharacterized protein conserved in bacteria (DUF2213)